MVDQPEDPERTLTFGGEESSAPQVVRRIGAYHILSELGHGGMGTVYLAARADDEFQRRVAIKTIRGFGSDDVVRYFRRERQVLAALDHPNIGRLYDGGTTEDGVPYFVMEWVEGVPIDRFCDERRLSVEGRLRLFLGVCAAVEYAHQNLVVHRDLKPTNILVDPQGVPKLLDFGIAKLLDSEAGGPATGTAVAMTPEYASPEQTRGQPVTTATDVYSLGVVLYELLTGHRPYGRGARSAMEVMKAVCEEEPERPSSAVGRTERRTLPDGELRFTTPESAGAARESTPRKLRRRLHGDLENIVLMALRKEPQQRYRSVEALSEDIRRYLEGRPVAAHRATVWYRSSKFVRRHALGVGAAATVVLLALGLAVVTSLQSRRVARERDRANREAMTAQRVSEFLVNLFNISDPGENRGSTITARELLDRAVHQIEGQLHNEPNVKGTLLETMGSVYDNLGLEQQALDLTEKAVAQYRAAPRPDEAAVGRALVQLALIHVRRGEYEEAEPLYREALAFQERALGPEHADVGRTLDDLGVFYQEAGKYDQAEALHRRALATLEKTRGPRSRDAAIVLTNLANLYTLRGQYSQAEDLEQRALAIEEYLLGPDHPEVISGLNNLATIEFNREEYEKAEALLRRVLALYEKTEGPDHPDVGIALNNLANAAQVRGDFALAEASLRRAVALFEKAGMPEHPTALVALANLATVCRDTGRYAEAEVIQRRALDVDRRILGTDNPNVGFDLHRLAGIVCERGHPAEAEALQGAAVAAIEKALGADHPTFALALMGLGDVARAEGRRGEAEAAYTRALRISEKALGPGSGDVAELDLRLAALEQEAGRSAQAVGLLDTTLAMSAVSAAGGHATLARTIRHAEALLLLGREAQARPLVEKVFATGYRRQPFVALCARHGLRPPGGS